jgi:aryl-alcohol dehydrogenase-like predicted oxidoreductase
VKSRARFALLYVVAHPAVTCAVPGTARPDYLHDNVGTARATTPEESIRRRMAALVNGA